MMTRRIVITLLITILMTTIVFAGGGRQGTAEGAPMDIELMTNSYVGGGWPDDFMTIRHLNEMLNINLKITWIPADNYIERLNVMAASRTFPDSYFTPQLQYTTWQDTGIFVDLYPVINNYRNLTTHLDRSGFEVMNPPSRYYGIPYYAIESRDSLYIRQDWLNILGLQMPDTTEDFLNVARAFATRDPDGNGRADTIGYTTSLAITDTLFYISGAFGVPNGWKIENGRPVPWQTSVNEMKAFLTFMNRMYTEDAIDRDLVINRGQDPQNKFVSGRAGIFDNNPMNLHTIIRPPLEENVPTAVIVPMRPPMGPTGLRASKTYAISNKVVINSSIPVNKQTRILELYDYMLSDEGYDIIKNGFEGVHYQSNNDGTYSMLPRFNDDRPFIISTWFIRRYDPIIQIRKWDSRELANEISAAINNAGNYIVRNPAHGLVSQTDTRVGVNINERLNEIIARIIVGELNVNAYDAAADDWLRSGGTAIINEITAEYNRMN